MKYRRLLHDTVLFYQRKFIITLDKTVWGKTGELVVYKRDGHYCTTRCMHRGICLCTSNKELYWYLHLCLKQSMLSSLWFYKMKIILHAKASNSLSVYGTQSTKPHLVSSDIDIIAQNSKHWFLIVLYFHSFKLPKIINKTLLFLLKVRESKPAFGILTTLLKIQSFLDFRYNLFLRFQGVWFMNTTNFKYEKNFYISLL